MFSRIKDNTDYQARFADDLASYLSQRIELTAKTDHERIQTLHQTFAESKAHHGPVLGRISMGIVWLDRTLSD
jgi:hypothetical protein